MPRFSLCWIEKFEFSLSISFDRKAHISQTLIPLLFISPYPWVPARLSAQHHVIVIPLLILLFNMCKGQSLYACTCEVTLLYIMEVLKPSSALRSPLRSLLYVFCGWKALLLAIALGSPGPGYDTSTSLILPPVLTPEFGLSIAERLAEKLTRWDAIYYTTVASRDYLFEQEWAFGWGWTRLISFFCAGTGKNSCSSNINDLTTPRPEGHCTW
jgi:phosphatidylinositol glycan class V